MNNLAALSSSFAFSLWQATRDYITDDEGVFDWVRTTAYLQYTVFLQKLRNMDETQNRIGVDDAPCAYGNI